MTSLVTPFFAGNQWTGVSFRDSVNHTDDCSHRAINSKVRLKSTYAGHQSPSQSALDCASSQSHYKMSTAACAEGWPTMLKQPGKSYKSRQLCSSLFVPTAWDSALGITISIWCQSRRASRQEAEWCIYSATPHATLSLLALLAHFNTYLRHQYLVEIYNSCFPNNWKKYIHFNLINMYEQTQYWRQA